MSDRPANHGYAAFAREDVDDARRGRPAVDLTDYATARGLEFHGRGRLAGFRQVLPFFEEEQHNLMRGVLPGGRFGVLFHELLQTHGPDHEMQGVFHRVKTSLGDRWWRVLIPNRTNIPILGNFLDPPTDHRPRKAFDTQGAWSPTTTAGIPVPETVSRLDGLRMIVAGRAGKKSTAHNVNLSELGAPGWRANPGWIERADLDRLISGSVAEALAPLTRQSYAAVTVDHGMVMVMRNGYVIDPAELDAFGGIASALADALERACRDGRRPVSFAQPLAPCPWEQPDPKAAYLHLPKPWENDFRDFAVRHRYALEDPKDWHERFASAPLPGRALAVMRTPSGARVLFTTDVEVAGPRAVRAAVAWASDAEPTPPGGVASAKSGTTTAVRDGVEVVWSHRLFGHAAEADAFVEGLVASVRPSTAVLGDLDRVV